MMGSSVVFGLRRASGLRALSFLRVWLRRPRSVGAIMPSSSSLAAAIAQEIDFERPGAVVEIGGGTGSITAALVESISDPADIVVIERESDLCALLRARFPAIRVIHGDARNFGRLLADVGIGRVNAVVSGLPLLSMPARTRFRIVHQAFAVIDQRGVFVQFTYGWIAPVQSTVAESLGVIGQRTRWILRNLPPAALWRYRHATEPTEAQS